MKTFKNAFFLIAILLLLASSGCIENFTIRGNGIEETELRYTESFRKIKSSGSFNIHISNGDEFEIVVNAETNVLPYIETNVYGNTLEIDIRGLHNVKNTLPMEVYITSPDLEGIKQSGSGIITTDFFNSTNFDLSVSGSGRIETAVDCHNFDAKISGSGFVYISGNTDNADYKISGSGKIDAYDFLTTDCFTSVSGSGDIYAHVERFLSATISGSGSVFYIGAPDINQHISGSGKIINDN